jgi:hypothetical protein
MKLEIDDEAIETVKQYRVELEKKMQEIAE